MGEVFKLNHCYNMDCLPAMELFPDNYFDLAVVNAGDFLCTAYCTEKREHICGTGTGITASGAPVEADVTVAADPDVFPFGTVLYIEDVGVRIVQDKGAGIQGKHLDIAVSGSHEDALSWQGYGTHRVWIIQEAAK